MIARLRKAMYAQLVPLVVGLVVLTAIVAVRSVLIETMRVDNQLAAEALAFERRVVGLLGLVQDAETGQRGYLLTSEPEYLEPYRVALETLPGEIEALRGMASGNDRRVSAVGELESTIDTKLSELARTLEVHDSGDTAGALTLVRMDTGKALMDRIRQTIDELRREENATLAAMSSAAERTETLLRYGSLAALAAVLLLAIFGATTARRLMREALAAHAGMVASNEALRKEISAREAAESQIRQMQKMEAVGQLTGGIAHDFNNMLAVITSAMNLTQRRLARGDVDIGKFIEAAADAAVRAAKLTARLLAFARQQPLAPQVVDANRLVTSMSDLLHRTLGPSVDLETVLAGGLWRTMADTSQLENAVLNLSVNARDAMPEGGKLTIETANCHLDDRYSEMHVEVPPGQYVLIAVTDTGDGMPPDVAAKAFDPFFTTKPAGRGTGLGLSQVFGFVKQSGGHVKIYSEPGQGTSVKIYLPRFLGELREEDAPRQPDLGKAPVELILVVEDDPRVRVSTVAAVRELGYPVLHAADADEALRLLGANPGIALLFTDIVMPGVNGRQLAETARQSLPALKVLFTTGFTRNAVVHNGVLDADVEFIAKPFTLDELAVKIRAVLDRDGR
jgi:signal transduction histidine kinase